MSDRETLRQMAGKINVIIIRYMNSVTVSVAWHGIKRLILNGEKAVADAKR